MTGHQVLHYTWHVYETGPTGGRGRYLGEHGTGSRDGVRFAAQRAVSPGRNVEVGVLVATVGLGGAVGAVRYEALDTYWGERKEA